MIISILGKNSELALALQKKLVDHQVTAYDQQDCDLTKKENIKSIVEKTYQTDVIIICSGVYKKDCWDTYIVNLVGPAYFLEQLATYKSTAHVIVIGSHSQMWTSWPGIDLHRLSYNTSKNALQNYVSGIEQSNQSTLRLTMFNPTRFQSTMSDHTGYSIDIIVEAIESIIKLSVPPLIYEFGAFRDN